MRTEFIDEPFEIEITDDRHAIVSWPDGPRFRMPIHVCRENMARTHAALALHDAGDGTVLPPEVQTKLRH